LLSVMFCYWMAPPGSPLPGSRGRDGMF